MLAGAPWLLCGQMTKKAALRVKAYTWCKGLAESTQHWCFYSVMTWYWCLNVWVWSCFERGAGAFILLKTLVSIKYIFTTGQNRRNHMSYNVLSSTVHLSGSTLASLSVSLEKLKLFSPKSIYIYNSHPAFIKYLKNRFGSVPVCWNCLSIKQPET